MWQDGLQSKRLKGKSLLRCGVEVEVRSTGFMENVVLIWKKKKFSNELKFVFKKWYISLKLLVKL